MFLTDYQLLTSSSKKNIFKSANINCGFWKHPAGMCLCAGCCGTRYETQPSFSFGNSVRARLSEMK